MRGRHVRTAGVVWAAAVVMVLGPGAVGCSSGGGGGTAGTPSASVPGPADPAAARAEIEKNWAAFFNPKTPGGERAGLLENGADLAPLLAGLTDDANAAELSAEVTDVAFTTPTEARVTYDLVLSGLPVLPGGKGTAVLQDRVWKVSEKTVCSLVELSGKSAPGC
ncbi:hypothetical protein [Streptomyces sp. NPDC051211]|uniref:hypothetical protein n=1 Tax=Streptomyces sp. NPDC051211 TaxID=3154643 RepID=UPI00344B865B